MYVRTCVITFLIFNVVCFPSVLLRVCTSTIYCFEQPAYVQNYLFVLKKTGKLRVAFFSFYRSGPVEWMWGDAIRSFELKPGDRYRVTFTGFDCQKVANAVRTQSQSACPHKKKRRISTTAAAHSWVTQTGTCTAKSQEIPGKIFLN